MRIFKKFIFTTFLIPTLLLGSGDIDLHHLLAIDAPKAKEILRDAHWKNKKLSQIDELNAEGLTLIQRAHHQGQLEIVNLLLQLGANPQLLQNHLQTDLEGNKYLSEAARQQNLDLCSLLLNLGVDVHSLLESDDQQFIWLVLSTVYQKSMSKYWNLNTRNAQGKTPLNVVYETYGSDSRIIDLLLKMGINIHSCLAHNDLSRVEKALKLKRIDINARDDQNHTPLFIALNNRNKAMIHLLLQNGANIHGLISYPDQDFVLEILKTIPKACLLNFNQENENGKRPIEVALAQNNLPLIVTLLTLDAPIHPILLSIHIDSLDKILSEIPTPHIKVNALNKDDLTPLDVLLNPRLASINKNKVCLLAKYGAALHPVIKFKNPALLSETINSIPSEDRKNRINQRTSHHKTALYMAVVQAMSCNDPTQQERYDDMIQMLVNLGADIHGDFLCSPLEQTMRGPDQYNVGFHIGMLLLNTMKEEDLRKINKQTYPSCPWANKGLQKIIDNRNSNPNLIAALLLLGADIHPILPFYNFSFFQNMFQLYPQINLNTYNAEKKTPLDILLDPKLSVFDINKICLLVQYGAFIHPSIYLNPDFLSSVLQSIPSEESRKRNINYPFYYDCTPLYIVVNQFIQQPQNTNLNRSISILIHFGADIHQSFSNTQGNYPSPLARTMTDSMGMEVGMLILQNAPDEALAKINPQSYPSCIWWWAGIQTALQESNQRLLKVFLSLDVPLHSFILIIDTESLEKILTVSDITSIDIPNSENKMILNILDAQSQTSETMAKIALLEKYRAKRFSVHFQDPN